jgi:hypothetical protein
MRLIELRPQESHEEITALKAAIGRERQIGEQTNRLRLRQQLVGDAWGSAP